MYKKCSIGLAAALALVLCLGCAAQKGKEKEKAKEKAQATVPHEDQLRERVVAFHQAWARKDKAAIVKMIMPGKCREEFEPRLEPVLKTALEVADWRILEVRVNHITPPIQGGEKAKAMALVALYVQIKDAQGKLNVLPGCTDYWAFCKGKWYWYWNEVGVQ